MMQAVADLFSRLLCTRDGYWDYLVAHVPIGHEVAGLVAPAKPLCEKLERATLGSWDPP